MLARLVRDRRLHGARRREKLKALARKAGGSARAGPPGEAAQDADALLLAVHWSRLDDVLGQAGDLSGKVVVSCSLPMNDDDTELVAAHTSSGAEELARRARGVRVVSAFNTVPSEVLFDVAVTLVPFILSRRRRAISYTDDSLRGFLHRAYGVTPPLADRARTTTCVIRRPRKLLSSEGWAHAAAWAKSR